MAITITCFERSPDSGRGLARDMCVRWALEEAGQPYQVKLLSFDALKETGHRAQNPFGQIPTFQDEIVKLFESGAIVLYIAERYGGLLPSETGSRARAISWMFAALNTVEPPIFERSLVYIFEQDQPWFDHRLVAIDKSIRSKLTDLSNDLGTKEWLKDDFSAADILMVTVLRRLQGTGHLEAFPNIARYVVRGENRPAFHRAFDAQLAVFTASLQT